MSMIYNLESYVSNVIVSLTNNMGQLFQVFETYHRFWGQNNIV